MNKKKNVISNEPLEITFLFYPASLVLPIPMDRFADSSVRL